MNRKKYRTDILFPHGSLFIGMGSVFNLAGKYFEFNTSKTGILADRIALESDWGMIGNDLTNTMGRNPKSKEKNLVK